MNFRAKALTSTLVLLIPLSAYASKSDEATIELQSAFPVCSEVLQARSEWQSQKESQRHSQEQGQEPENQAQEHTDESENGLQERPELIAELDQLKKQGAKLDAYYRLGTPLHHAICARWNNSALWLLRNGANPLLDIQTGWYDALGVAVRTENWDMASAILKHYQRLHKATAVPAKKQDSIDESVRRAGNPEQTADKFAKLLKKIGWQPSAKEWGKKYGQLLCRGQPKAALDIIKAKPWGKSPPVEVSDVTWTCPKYIDGQQPPSVLLKAVDLPYWHSLDALLPNPVLLPLVPVLPPHQAVNTLQTALASGMRAPWLNKAFATVYLQAVLSRQTRKERAAEEEARLLRLIPEMDISELLSTPKLKRRRSYDDGTELSGGEALLHSGHWPLADLEWLLAKLSPTVIKSAQDHLHRWPGTASATQWELVTSRLIAPLSIPYGYPKSLPYSLWSKWKILGAIPAEPPTTPKPGYVYTWDTLLDAIPMAQLPQALATAQQLRGESPQRWPTDKNWAKLLLRSGPEELPVFLATIKAQRPDLLPRLMDWALAPLTYGPTPDPVVLALTPTSLSPFDAQSYSWQRVRKLAATGLKSRHPRYLPANLSKADSDVISIANEALRNGWAISPPTVAAPTGPAQASVAQWIKPQLRCDKQVDDALRRDLTQNAGNERDADEYVLPVQIEGLNDCQWLFVGGEYRGKKSWTDYNFFEGNQLQQTGAADGTRYAMFWHAGEQKRLQSGVVPNSGEAMLVHQSGQPAPWIAVSGDMNYGRSDDTNDLFQARLSNDKTVELVQLPMDHPARVNLMNQCGSDLMLEDCKMLKELNLNSEKMSIAQFADQHWPKARQDFLDALMRNDRTALKQMHEQGLFSHWLSEGLRALGSASSLGLMDKRRRAAWVLASRKPLPHFDNATLDKLIPWLPPEDWHPIVSNLDCGMHPSLLVKVKDSKNFALAARLEIEMRLLDCPSQ
jgi:hypothetical protein